MLCPRCGTPNRAKAVRCLRCGSSLKGRPTAVDPVPNRPMPEAPSTKQSQLPRFQSEEATLHDGDKQVSLPPPRTASVRPPISEVGFNDQTEGRTNMLDTPTMIDPASDTGGESDEWAELLAAARPGGSKIADPASARRQQRAPTAAPVEPQVAVPAHRAPQKKTAPPAHKPPPERRPPGANTMRALANDLRAPVGPRTPAADSGQRRIANAPTNARATPGTPRNSTAAVRPKNAPLKEPMNPSSAKLPAFRSDTKPPARRRRPIPSEPKVPSFPAPTPSDPDLGGIPFVDETKPLDPLPTAKRVENKPTAPLPKPVQHKEPIQKPMTDDLHLNTGSMRSMPVEFDPVEDEDGPPDENTRLGFLAEPPSQPDLQLAQPDLQLAVTPIPDIIQPDDSRDMARKELQRLPSDTSDEPLEVTRAFVGELDPDFSMPGDPAPLGSETDWSPAADRSDTAVPRNDTAAVSVEPPVVSHRGPTETPKEKQAPEGFASLPRRMGSLAIDAVVLVALFLCLGVAGILGEPWASIDLFEPDEVGRALILGQLNLGLFVGLVLAFLYSLLCHGIMGRSLGKLIVGTKLVRSKDGESPSWSQTSLRAFLAIPGTLLAGIGIMWPFLSPRSRSLHDILSRTLVVRG